KSPYCKGSTLHHCLVAVFQMIGNGHWKDRPLQDGKKDSEKEPPSVPPEAPKAQGHPEPFDPHGYGQEFSQNGTHRPDNRNRETPPHLPAPWPLPDSAAATDWFLSPPEFPHHCGLPLWRQDRLGP